MLISDPPHSGQILVLCPTHRDRRELGRLCPQGYISHDYASLALEEIAGARDRDHPSIGDPIAEVERVLGRCRKVDVAAIISTDDYPGTTLACIVAKRLGLPGPDPGANLLCQHKYQSRLLQQRFVPEAVPQFALINVNDPAPVAPFSPPAFVKPIKSFFSIGSQRIASFSELPPICERWKRLNSFFRPFDRLCKNILGLDPDGNRLMIENLLCGPQVTVEGFVHRKEITILGIVDSILYPGTLAFERFRYPSQLSHSIQERMVEIACKVMHGLGYDNGMFNIEMIYDEKSECISIIEINPRMASQFADLYEKVDGINTYRILLDIAFGRQPHMVRRRGKYRMAVSAVLRTFEDRFVAALPTDMQCRKIAERYPDARIEILATAGKRLSDEMQDGHSFRYGIISFGAQTEDEIQSALSDCLEVLKFSLVP